jgi:hypothetical protein
MNNNNNILGDSIVTFPIGSKYGSELRVHNDRLFRKKKHDITRTIIYCCCIQCKIGTVKVNNNNNVINIITLCSDICLPTPMTIIGKKALMKLHHFVTNNMLMDANQIEESIRLELIQISNQLIDTTIFYPNRVNCLQQINRISSSYSRFME